jgi:dTDP-4-dehydrorhamnose reductase
VPDLVHATLDLLIDGETGIWHLTNQGAISLHELAKEAAAAAKLDRSLIRRIRTDTEAEPADTSLSSSRGILLRPLDRALSAFADQYETLTELR